MFVVNFDFSSYSFFPKLVAINIPVILTQIVTYPLQRLQVQLIKREAYLSGNQFKQIGAFFNQMIAKQGFPKCFHGLRYSLDYTITQMTFKFFIFDHLMITDWADSSFYALYFSCVFANAAATFFSQSAFNYQTIASSLQPSKSNTTESVKNILVKFTQHKSPFFNGLRYTLPISIINSLAQIFLITKLQGKFLRQTKTSDNQLAPIDRGYTREELIIASIVLSCTSFTNHFATLRQIQACFDLPKRINFTHGLLGSYLRYMGKGMILYSVYFKYFDWLLKKQLQSTNPKRQTYNQVPKHNRSRGVLHD